MNQCVNHNLNCLKVMSENEPIYFVYKRQGPDFIPVLESCPVWRSSPAAKLPNHTGQTSLSIRERIPNPHTNLGVHDLVNHALHRIQELFTHNVDVSIIISIVDVFHFPVNDPAKGGNSTCYY